MLSAENLPLPIRPLVGIGISAMVVQVVITYVFQSVDVLMGSSSIVNGAVACWMSVVVWRHLRPYGWRIAMLMTLPFSAVAFGYLLRLAALVAVPDTALLLFAAVLIVTLLAWASIVLELGFVALKERQTSRALEVALRQADASAQARTRFLFGVSHQLRTPLYGILGLSELMRSDAVDAVSDAHRPYVRAFTLTVSR
ncbi:MAG: histidine kinase dimerization/phospho-acceptor domain-containing protein [Pseudomonadota bacterium]